MERRCLDVLLVEDNDGDIILIRLALDESRAPVRLHVAKDGVEALAFVQRGQPRPDLIILDLNLPRKSGREVLAELKAHPDLKEIPVVIFTSSRADRDVRTAYRAHANTYVRKPEDIDEFYAAVAGLHRYWSETALLPAG
jgi:CheY-like chemotaxis protein